MAVKIHVGGWLQHLILIVWKVDLWITIVGRDGSHRVGGTALTLSAPTQDLFWEVFLPRHPIVDIPPIWPAGLFFSNPDSCCPTSTLTINSHAFVFVFTKISNVLIQFVLLWYNGKIDFKNYVPFSQLSGYLSFRYITLHSTLFKSKTSYLCKKFTTAINHTFIIALGLEGWIVWNKSFGFWSFSSSLPIIIC